MALDSETHSGRSVHTVLCMLPHAQVLWAYASARTHHERLLATTERALLLTLLPRAPPAWRRTARTTRQYRAVQGTREAVHEGQRQAVHEGDPAVHLAAGPPLRWKGVLKQVLEQPRGGAGLLLACYARLGYRLQPQLERKLSKMAARAEAKAAHASDAGQGAGAGRTGRN